MFISKFARPTDSKVTAVKVLHKYFRQSHDPVQSSVVARWRWNEFSLSVVNLRIPPSKLYSYSNNNDEVTVRIGA